MHFSYLALLVFQYFSWITICQVYGAPLEQNQTALIQNDDDDAHSEEYANLKHILIYNYGYSKEFTDLVEINLKRAVREEKERQRREGTNPSGTQEEPNRQRQQQISEEEYDDESTTPPGPTTPGASPGDVVRGIAGIFTGLGTFNVGAFWNSFVNFFPPNQREGAQAVADSALGRRPSKWPTLPSTTTKLTTTTKDEDEIDSEETTKAVTAASAQSGTPVPGLPGEITPAPAATATAAAPSVAPAAVTETATKSATTKYTLRRRTGTVFPENEIDNALVLLGSPTGPPKPRNSLEVEETGTLVTEANLSPSSSTSSSATSTISSTS